jgi:hypothetical protein
MRAALAGLDEGTFTEGHELDRKTEKKVPKAMIGRRLSHWTSFGMGALQPQKAGGTRSKSSAADRST